MLTQMKISSGSTTPRIWELDVRDSSIGKNVDSKDTNKTPSGGEKAGGDGNSGGQEKASIPTPFFI